MGALLLTYGRTASVGGIQVNTAAYSSDAAPPRLHLRSACRRRASAPPGLEEVIVTGTKRAENIQSVPSSVFVATALSMERANIRDFDDLVKIAPSLTITKTSQPANNSINIRGIGTYAYSIATESSVAVVVDDIPQAFQAEAFSSFVDVKQVEVLRGPQNTLFGKSASAGVVNITTRSADRHLHRSRGGHAHVRRRVTLSGDRVRTDRGFLEFRLSVNHSEYQGNVYDLSTGTWLNGEQDTTVRGNCCGSRATRGESLFRRILRIRRPGVARVRRFSSVRVSRSARRTCPSQPFCGGLRSGRITGQPAWTSRLAGMARTMAVA